MKKKKNIFDLIDDNNDNNNDLEENFNNALKKKQFLGEKGKYLFDLQNSYNDSRFKIDNKFKDDININKINSSLKDNNKNNEYSYNDNIKISNDEDIQNEKNNNLKILSNILPNTAYIGKKINSEISTNKLLIKRFDPKLNFGKFGVQPIKVENKKENKIEKNKINLKKGVEVFKESLPLNGKNNKNEIKNKYEREKEIFKKINEINNDMNQEIIVNYDIWKKGIKDDKIDFKLFEDENENKEKEEKKEKKLLDNDSDNENNIELKKKRKREEKIKKEKKKKKKEKKIKKIEKINNEYVIDLKERFGEEKTNNYIKYVDLINKKKFKK